MYRDLQHQPPVVTLSDLAEIGAVLGIFLLLVVLMMGTMIFALGEPTSPAGRSDGSAMRGVVDLSGAPHPEDDPRRPRP
jgi:hypothetical protein